jgi:hypothetical protein
MAKLPSVPVNARLEAYKQSSAIRDRVLGAKMSHLDVDEFDGWETYPRNLHLSSLDVDDSRIDSRISQLAKDLFVDKDASTFRYLELSTSGQGSYLFLHIPNIC